MKKVEVFGQNGGLFKQIKLLFIVIGEKVKLLIYYYHNAISFRLPWH